MKFEDVSEMTLEAALSYMALAVVRTVPKMIRRLTLYFIIDIYYQNLKMIRFPPKNWLKI